MESLPKFIEDALRFSAESQSQQAQQADTNFICAIFEHGDEKLQEHVLGMYADLKQIRLEDGQSLTPEHIIHRLDARVSAETYLEGPIYFFVGDVLSYIQNTYHILLKD